MRKYITQIIKLIKYNIKSYAKLIFCVAFYFITFSESLAIELTSQNKKHLKQIENYLNNIKYLSANFIQESPDKSMIEGLFYLARPGKMRVEYTTKPKILIIVNGSVLSYIDVELNETTHLSTNSTPASFLTRKNISFDAKDVEITQMIDNDKHITVSILKKNKKEAGEFTLTFQKNPFRFVKMKVKNELGEETSIILNKTNFTKKLSNHLFVTKKYEEELY
ncbi:MAG: outer membrane lipoprotein carrier protein LolA [Rickettsiales bacterium]|nr:outer membrane lipoprotein carrier protein LolA [Rickettsiales bacterium]